MKKHLLLTATFAFVTATSYGSDSGITIPEEKIANNMCIITCSKKECSKNIERAEWCKKGCPSMLIKRCLAGKKVLEKNLQDIGTKMLSEIDTAITVKQKIAIVAFNELLEDIYFHRSDHEMDIPKVHFMISAAEALEEKDKDKHQDFQEAKNLIGNIVKKYDGKYPILKVRVNFHKAIDLVPDANANAAISAYLKNRY